MATITKLDSGIYEVRYSYYDPSGRRRQGKRRFDRKGEAAQFVTALERGEASHAQAPAFSAWIDQWFADYQLSGRLEASTISSYYNIIARLKAHFGNTRLDRITPSMIDKLYVRMQNPAADVARGVEPIAHEPLSSSTCQRHHAVLRRALKFAVRDGLIPHNPADLVDRPKSSTVEIIPPDAPQVGGIMDGIEDPGKRFVVCLAFFTGLRQSELFGLKWQDVDFSASQIHVLRVRQYITPHNLQRIALDAHTRVISYPGCRVTWIERDRTKAKHIRTLTLPDAAMQLLREERQRQAANRLRMGGSYIVTDYVCVHDDGLPFAGWAFKGLLDGSRFHDLRHANATLLIDAKQPITEVSRRLGHTSINTTARTYAHALQTQDQQAAAAMGEIIKSINSEHSEAPARRAK